MPKDSPPPALTPAELNRRNAEFWEERGEEMRERLADPAVAAAAQALAVGPINRTVPITQQPSYEVILDQAEQVIGVAKPILVDQASPRIREGVIRERARQARAARARDPLTQLIEDLVKKRPDISCDELLLVLRSRVKGGVILDIDDEEIGYLTASGRSRATPVSGLPSRLSRAKARHRKLR